MSEQRQWWPVYLKHGARIHAEQMGRHKVARLFGLDLNSARRLCYHIKVHGPPFCRDVAPEVHREEAPVHMVIGDAHAAPGQDLRRFEWAARFALDHRPDVVISIGEWYGLDSLCKHSSKIESEGLRLLDDLKAGNAALKRFGDVLNTHNRITPDDFYMPRLVVTLGNHDARIIREAADHPQLEGLLGYQLMDWESWGWEVVPFKQPIEIDGVHYCHYFTRSGSPRAMSGMHHAAALIREGMGRSLVCGHSHQLHYYTKAAGISGKRAHGLVVGCFFEHWEHYASTGNQQWWRGLVLLRNVIDGDFDLELWAMDRIKDRYNV